MIEQQNNEYIVSELAFRISEAAVTGMLYEVSTSPSPGLVSPFSNGIHKDMDFFTFLKSTSSIAQAMALCAQVGISHKEERIVDDAAAACADNDVDSITGENATWAVDTDADTDDDDTDVDADADADAVMKGDFEDNRKHFYIALLKKIREVGIQAERHMLNKTQGVNTQRGILFAAGVVCAAAGVCVRKGLPLERDHITWQSAQITKGIVERELKSVFLKDKLTNGEKVYVKYGISGIRGELQGGLKSVIDVGLPLYETALEGGHTIMDALVHALIGLMSVVQDTVVINKAGIEGMHFMHESAEKAMKLGGMLTEQGRAYIHYMEESFISRKISPGGAADLLAVTVMISELEKIRGL